MLGAGRRLFALLSGRRFCNGLLVLTATTVALTLFAGCGGDSGDTGRNNDAPEVKRQDVGDYAHMSMRKIWSPNHEAFIECVVLTADFYKSGAVSVSCDWP